MERRRERRYKANQDFQVTLLGDTDIHLPAKLINLSGRGLSITLNQPIPLGAPIRLDINNRLLLGEVCYCREWEGVFQAGIVLKHSLGSISDLARLMEAILGPQPGSSGLAKGGRRSADRSIAS